MGTIAEELQTLAANKAAIKAAIEAKNPSVPPTNDMSQWASSIQSISATQEQLDAIIAEILATEY